MTTTPEEVAMLRLCMVGMSGAMILVIDPFVRYKYSTSALGLVK
jgi:hypothetical protein